MSDNHRDDDRTQTHIQLTKDTMVGHYRIVERIGAGGMGEVYLADDTQLNRKVALKFLLPYLCQDTDGRARFKREAQAAAALSHTNIVTVHEVSEYEGRPYIAMEYLEGQSLRDVLSERELSLERIIGLVIQICDGLAAAHRAGITHRDIKPSNVCIGPGDSLKILDFGLAVSECFEQITRTGSTLGTVDYMSPEQARGDDIDRRSDLFSVGVMLYELVTGNKPFRRNNQIATLQAIVNDEPEPLVRFKPGISAELQRIVSKLLSKKPETRYQHADDIAVDLRALNSQSTVGALPTIPGKSEAVSNTRNRLYRLIPWIVAILALILTFRQMLNPAKPLPQPTMRWPVTIPNEYRLTANSANQVAVSPDGSRWISRAIDSTPTAYALLWEGDKDIPVTLNGSQRCRALFFSPDGNWLGFFNQINLAKLHISGGEPVELCAGAPMGGCWTPDDTIYFCHSFSSGIWKISANGGDPVQVTTVKNDEFGHWSPEVLPEKRGLLFTIWNTSLKDIATGLLDFTTGDYRILIRGGSNARWVPTGHLVYIRRGTLMAVPFDLEALEITGSETPIIQNVAYNSDAGIGSYSFSQNGLLIYHRRASEKRRIIWVDQNGTMTPLPYPQSDYDQIQLSPDEKNLSFIQTHDGAINIWIAELATGRSRQLTFESENCGGIWHPSGERLAFTTYRNGPFSVYEIPVDRNQPERPLIIRDVDIVTGTYTPDGKYLLVENYAPETSDDIMVLSLDDTSKTYHLVEAPYPQRFADVHPEGEWVAYNSLESGRDEVFIKHISGEGRGIQVSVHGGSYPCWSVDGKLLYYWKNDILMVAPISIEPEPQIGTPRELFEMTGVISYDVASDGRFILVRGDPESNPQIIAVTNWFEELMRLMEGEK